MNNRWTNHELLTLGDLYRNGLTSKQIGEKLGRTSRSVEHAISRYRDVINVPYKKPGLSIKPGLSSKPEPVVEPKKPWWKFW